MKVIKWTQDEWNELVAKMYKIRIRNPELSLPQLAKKAQVQLVQEKKWKQDRVRVLATVQMMEPILQKFREIAGIREDAYAQLDSLKEQHIPTKEEILDELTLEEKKIFFGEDILNNLTPDEVISYFSPHDLLALMPTSELVGYATQRFASDILTKELKVHHTLSRDPSEKMAGFKFGSTNNIKLVKPKVAVVGAKPEQFSDLVRDYKNIDFLAVDKMRLNERKIPKVDKIICWKNFLSHTQIKIICEQGRKMEVTPLMIAGGYKTVCDKLEAIMPQE